MGKFILLLTIVFVPLTTHAAVITNLAIAAGPGEQVTRTFSLEVGQRAQVVATVLSPNFPPTPGGFPLVQIIDGYRIPRVPIDGLTLYGPCTLEIAFKAGSIPAAALLTLEVDASVSKVPTSVDIPSNAVVIPADGGGPVTVLLESSVDFITWNSALPGTYGTSTTNRFFRVRAIRQ